jgi:hypothetical protein
LKLRKPKFPSSNVLASTKIPVRRKDVVISASEKVEGKYKHVSLNIYEPSKTRNKKNLLLLIKLVFRPNIKIGLNFKLSQPSTYSTDIVLAKNPVGIQK